MLGCLKKTTRAGDETMPLIEWSDSLSVDVTEIDQQHKKLIGMINDLHEAMLQRKGAGVLASLLDGMAAYADDHFKVEERYFDRFGYPDAPDHRKKHADFIAKVDDFKSKFAANEVGMTVEVMSFLSSWLQNHIKGEDKKYSSCFKVNGLN
jgi:hemerythrin